MDSDSERSEKAIPVCGTCGNNIDADEEYIAATCIKCGDHDYHVDCLRPLLARIHHDSTRATERARRLVQNKPAYYMAQERLRCPHMSGCEGKTIAAEMVKPAKASPPPPPPPPPKQKRGPPPRPVPKPTKKPVAAPPAGPSKQEVQQQQRALAAAMRTVVAPGYEAASAASDSRWRSGRGGTSSLRGSSAGGLTFAPGRRPVELQMCQHWEEIGECFIHMCPKAHGEEDLREREQAWQAREEAKRREQRRKELERHEAERAARAEQAQWVEQAAAREREVLEHEEAYLRMAEATLKLMKDHKRSLCVASLIDMGFSDGAAAAAADAAAADVSAAAALLMEGALLAGAKPVSVTGEAQEVLAYAASLGLGLAEAEMALIVAGGDWEAAREQLGQQAEQGAACASVQAAEADQARLAAAAAREEAELAAALAASTSGAATAYNVAQAAAAAREEAELAAALAASTDAAATAYNVAQAAAAAREEAELAAALEASRAEAQRYQQAYGTPLRARPAVVAPGPPPPPSLPQAAQLQGSSGLGAAFYDATAKQQMPEYRGGLDMGPAAVAAAVSGRSSSETWPAASSAASPWTEPGGPLPAATGGGVAAGGRAGAGTSPSQMTMPAAGGLQAASGQALPSSVASWQAAPAVGSATLLPLAGAPTGSMLVRQAPMAATASWGAQLPASASLAAPTTAPPAATRLPPAPLPASAATGVAAAAAAPGQAPAGGLGDDLDELMSLMGLGE